MARSHNIFILVVSSYVSVGLTLATSLRLPPLPYLPRFIPWLYSSSLMQYSSLKWPRLPGYFVGLKVDHWRRTLPVIQGATTPCRLAGRTTIRLPSTAMYYYCLVLLLLVCDYNQRLMYCPFGPCANPSLDYSGENYSDSY